MAGHFVLSRVCDTGLVRESAGRQSVARRASDGSGSHFTALRRLWMPRDRGPVGELAAHDVERGQDDCHVRRGRESIEGSVRSGGPREILAVIVGGVLLLVHRGTSQVGYHHGGKCL